MRVLAVSDKVEPVLYGPHIRERVGRIDLVLACGDVPYYYLDYIVSLLDVPLFFVHGNHDKPVPATPLTEIPVEDPPLSWGTDLHRRTVNYRGLLLAGLEGSPRYNPGITYQYTRSEVARQVFWLKWRLRWNRLRYGRYLDVLITHAPPFGIHDAEDVAHRGFQSYLSLLRWAHPLIMLHGHQHVYRNDQPRETEFKDVHIINVYGYRIFELLPCRAGGWQLSQSRL